MKNLSADAVRLTDRRMWHVAHGENEKFNKICPQARKKGTIFHCDSVIGG
jgi:hypothetical protein